MQAQAALLSAVVVAADASAEAPAQQAAGGAPLPFVRYLTQGLRSLSTSLHEIAASEAGASKRGSIAEIIRIETLREFMVIISKSIYKTSLIMLLIGFCIYSELGRKVC